MPGERHHGHHLEIGRVELIFLAGVLIRITGGGHHGDPSTPQAARSPVHIGTGLLAGCALRSASTAAASISNSAASAKMSGEISVSGWLFASSRKRLARSRRKVTRDMTLGPAAQSATSEP